jgi:hypothetical protein
LEVIAATAIPVLAFVLNWRVRSARGYALSAAADFVLALMVFDLGAVIAHDVFEAVIPSAFFRSCFIELFVILFCLSTILWATALLHIEHRLGQDYDFGTRSYLNSAPMGLFLLAWMLVAALLSPHIFPFLYRG